MATDPLAGSDTQSTQAPDPLAGWTPSPVVPQPDAPDPLAAAPKKGILDTSYQQVPTTANASNGIEWAPEVKRIIAAGQEAYDTSTPALTYDAREALKGPGRAADAVGPFIADLLSAGKADLSALGAGAQQFATELMGGAHVPANLQRDINLGVPAVLADAGVSAAGAPVGPFHPADAPAMREMMQPPSPTLKDVYRGPLATNADPVTASAIDMLRRATQPTQMPSPPEAFSLTPGPAPAPATPPGGLLGVGPPRVGAVPADTPILTQAEMLARAKGYYSPADQQAAQGAMITPDAANGIRSILTDAVPSDPQTAIAKGNTPLIQLGKDYQGFQDQPMSYDAAMELDQRLTQERQAAAKDGNAKLAGQIGDVQDQMRAKVESLGDSDTTGDPQTLANVAQARQAFMQSRKQGQLNDISYDASLLPEDRQIPYARTRVTSMLRDDNAMRGWTDDERASLETALQSGNIGTLKNVGISLIKPFAKVVGGSIGGSAFGVPGAIVGSEVAGGLADTGAARLRAYLGQLQLDPVSRQISAGVPPPP